MRKIFICVLLLALLIVVGCNRANDGTLKDNGVQVTNINVDNYYVKGSNIQSFSEVPKRVVVVGENETETLLALGLEKNILLTVAQNKSLMHCQKVIAGILIWSL